MSTDTQVRLLASMMANAVMFGIGAIVILTIPALAAHARILFPVMIVASFVFGGIAGHYYGPQMRARYWRRKDAQRLADDQRMPAP